jgi:hypothetical protein
LQRRDRATVVTITMPEVPRGRFDAMHGGPLT